VTLLFADLRGFTELSAALEMDPLVDELLAHVMDCLTEAVVNQAGTVVDYYGDGLVAMWNAPMEQPGHPELACRSALDMLDRLPSVAGDWTGLIESELRLGIGIHTGTVHVGNAGSARQAKYGPRGPNVHLACRVEGATKSLGVPVIATAATVERISKQLTAHRICRARMPGMREPIDLYAVRRRAVDSRLSAAWREYGEALRHFEAGEYTRAAQLVRSAEVKCGEVPWRFLAGEVERELGRQLRRRSTDGAPATAGGVITLNAK
jgi:adenylate cyclase